MRILSIETSCDETAVSIVEATGDIAAPHFKVLGNALYSQIDIHKEYGGVFPMLAKREHAKNLPPLLHHALSEAGMVQEGSGYSEETWQKIETILSRENGLYDLLRTTMEYVQKPDIDMITVTSGPGLEPALWVGISCAQALGILWSLPVVPANHMEGHIASVLIENSDIRHVTFPALALLVSGGHTEIVETTGWGQYKVTGQTRDDAVGEAFDKVARMLDLPYPGGPQISKLAAVAREKNLPRVAKFPRPMIHTDDYDFSFSGLKTAVLYYIRAKGELSQEDKEDIAREFEDTAVDVLLTKTKKALETTGARTLIIAGGVIANKKLRETFSALESELPISVKTPTTTLATDNALMIACAAYIRVLLFPELLKVSTEKIIANGNMRLG